MVIDNNKNYSKVEFLEYLRSLGLPYSYETLLTWERKGILPAPIKFGGKYRIYTGSQMIEYAGMISEYKNKQVESPAKFFHRP